MKAAISIPTRKPDPLARAAYAVYRACTSTGTSRGAASICQLLYPDDRLALALVERAPMTVATTTTAGWAAELVYTATGQFLESLGPLSAASRLIPKGLQVVFPPGASQVRLPIRPSGPIAAPVVAEGAPIAARAYSLSTVLLNPRKLGVLIVASREVATSPTVFVRMLTEDAGITLDSFVFGAGAGGLLQGVSPLATTAGAGGYPHQILADLGLLARAAQVAGGSGETTFVAAPGVAAQIAVSAPDLVIYASSAIAPAGRVIAVDAPSLAWAFGSDAPDIDIAIDATVHMDSVPLNIATGAQGAAVVASPTSSMFQQDRLAMRMLLDVAVGRRTAGGVAYSDTFTWSTANSCPMTIDLLMDEDDQDEADRYSIARQRAREVLERTEMTDEERAAHEERARRIRSDEVDRIIAHHRTAHGYHTRRSPQAMTIYRVTENPPLPQREDAPPQRTGWKAAFNALEDAIGDVLRDMNTRLDIRLATSERRIDELERRLAALERKAGP